MYDLLNQYRVENGVSELKIFDKAQAMSDVRSAELLYTYLYNQTCEIDEYGPHIRPDKTEADTISTQDCVLIRENEETITLLSEYQAGGLTQYVNLTADYALQRFKESSGHNANLLATDIYGMGISVFIGYLKNEDGTFKTYKVAAIMQDFTYQSE